MKKLALLAAVILFFGCAGLQENINMVNCKYTLLGVEPTDFNFTSINMDVVLGITNMARSKASVKRFSGDLYVNDINVTTLTLKDLEVEPQATKTARSSLEIPLTSFGKLAGLVSMQSASITYSVKGTMYFDTPIGEIGVPVTVYKSNLQ